jgi:hypothetical protein
MPRSRKPPSSGMTVLAASGDQGSQCQIRDGQAHVNFPASDPYVAACADFPARQSGPRRGSVKPGRPEP